MDGKIESDNQTINQIFLCYFLFNRFLLIMWYFLGCQLGNILNRNHTSNVEVLSEVMEEQEGKVVF